jgi:methionyl-tRNA synthetase
MASVIVPRQKINLHALENALIAALDDYYDGLSTAPGEVHVHLATSTPAHLADIARTIVQEHDPYRLTSAQQQHARQQVALQRAREANVHLLDLTDYDYADGIIRNLAKKIHWLEQEIRDLRDMP